MITLVLTLSLGLQTPESRPQPQVGSAAAKDERGGKVDEGLAVATPEAALRNFLIAMATRDETTLRAVTLRTEDLGWLLRGQPLPADQIEKIKDHMAKIPIRALKPGDEITLPGNRRLRVEADDVTAERTVLLPEGMPIPNRVKKIDGRWRVDAAPIIAARKAADAARKKAAESNEKKGR